MAQRDLFQNVVNELLSADDTVAAMRELVLVNGGHWSDCEGPALFEVQFLGITGSGMDPEKAVKNWISNVIAEISIDTAA
jgi:hypothetical protein